MGGAELRALVPTNMASVWILGAVEFQGWSQIMVPNFSRGGGERKRVCASLQTTFMAELNEISCVQSQF